MLFLLVTRSTAQTPTNFAGKWKFDKTKSSLDLIESTYDGTVILKVTQNASTIAFTEVWQKPGNADFETAADSYKLDGKERTTKSSVGTTKTTAKWSPDKKVLTITNIDIQVVKGVSQEFYVADTYTLSDDGLTLTVDRASRNPVTGKTSAKKVYRKQ